MEKYLLSRIFIDELLSVLELKNLPPKSFSLNDYEKLEPVLDEYILLIAGFYVRNNKEKYYGEIKKYFENIIANTTYYDIDHLIDFIPKYCHEFLEKIEQYPYTEKLFLALKKVYDVDPNRVIISNIDGKFYVGNIIRKQENYLPLACIKNLKELNDTLEQLIFSIEQSNTYFKHPLQVNDYDDAVIYILEWIIKNASAVGLSDLNVYFHKITNFINDITLTEFNHITKIGEFFGDELYLMNKRSEVNYETPYYLSFMLKNSYFELPNIRYGIDNINGNKVAHILAIQSAQRTHDPVIEKNIKQYIKDNIPKSKNFRQYNPEHLISLIMALGIFNGVGINKFEVPDYFPLRYQRFVNENKMNNEELDNFQFRLTNMMLYSYFKLTEYTDNLHVINYPETGYPVSFMTDDKCIFNDPFLQNLYEIGYNAGLKTRLDNNKLR